MSSSVSLKKSARFTVHQLVKKLIALYQPVAVRQHSFFINDVSESLTLHADKQIVSTIVNSLLYIAARCSANTAMKVSVKAYDESLLLTVTVANERNQYPSLSQFEGLQALCEKINGQLNIGRQVGHNNIISFSFLNTTNLSTCKKETNADDVSYVKYLKAS